MPLRLSLPLWHPHLACQTEPCAARRCMGQQEFKGHPVDGSSRLQAPSMLTGACSAPPIPVAACLQPVLCCLPPAPGGRHTTRPPTTTCTPSAAANRRNAHTQQPLPCADTSPAALPTGHPVLCSTPVTPREGHNAAQHCLLLVPCIRGTHMTLMHKHRVAGETHAALGCCCCHPAINRH